MLKLQSNQSTLLLSNVAIKKIAMDYKDKDNIDLELYSNEIKLLKIIQVQIIEFNNLNYQVNNDIEDYSILKDHYLKNNILLISNLNNNHSYFCDYDNFNFRIIHDWLHYINNLEFNTNNSLDHELQVYFKTLDLYLKFLNNFRFLEQYNNFDITKFKNLLFNELVAQLCYYHYYGYFSEFQKVVSYDYIDFDTLELI